ncbi:hypothetical protein DOY81_008487 [Sarcophaga bullata]|nr:hypothetical protein DOY81_008487 [Sarcophaga bullata]
MQLRLLVNRKAASKWDYYKNSRILQEMAYELVSQGIYSSIKINTISSLSSSHMAIASSPSPLMSIGSPPSSPMPATSSASPPITAASSPMPAASSSAAMRSASLSSFQCIPTLTVAKKRNETMLQKFIKTSGENTF